MRTTIHTIAIIGVFIGLAIGIAGVAKNRSIIVFMAAVVSITSTIFSTLTQ